MSAIRESTLRELASTETLEAARLVATGSGFSVLVRCGASERALTSIRGELRLFANLNTAAEFLRRIGIHRFEVDATNYERGRLRAARPDRAAALARTGTKLKQAILI